MPKFLDGESYEDGVIRLAKENAARMTDPPTQPLTTDEDRFDQIDYPDGTFVKWVCPCGGQLDVYYQEGHYRTFARCQLCGLQGDIHTG